MPKFIKYFLLTFFALILLTVAGAFAFKGYRYLQASSQVSKVNSCLEAGGCMDPKTMQCGPPVANDPNVMCGSKQLENK